MPPVILILTIMCAAQVSLKGSKVLSVLMALSLGAGPFETGMLFALHGLFPFLFSVVAGRIADRLDNRVLMMSGFAGFALALALPFALPTLPMLYFAVALGGFTSMLFVLAAQNQIGNLSTPETRVRNYSYYSLGESISGVVGPIAVGFSIDAFTHAPTYLGLAVFTALLVPALYARWNAIPATSRKETEQARGSTRELLALPAMRNALATNGMLMAGFDLFGLFMPVYAHQAGISASGIGLIMGAYGVSTFLIRMAIPWMTARWGVRAVVAGALGLTALAFCAIPFTQSPVLLGVCSFVVGLGIGCGQPLSITLAFNASPPGRTAEGIAMRLTVSYGAHIVIPPAFGVIGAGFGLGPIFWVCALLLAGGAWMNVRPAAAIATPKKE